ncbi:MAG TPA: lysophospholipid acyltransferase family protein [Isosphaeraceae bacterium]
MRATFRRRPPRSVTSPAAPPRVSPRWQSWVRRYARGYLARHVHAVRLARGGPATAELPAGPLIVALNHPSWWDPVLCGVLSGLFPGRWPVAPIDAEALERYPILGRIGLFGVAAGPRGARQFLRIGAAVLADPGRTLWVTVQGRFADPRERPVHIRPGVGHLAARVPGTIVVPLALEYPFWGERTPEALARFGDPIRLEGATPTEWTERVARGLEAAQDALTEAAIARDPAAFEVLVGGRAGVGGVYDLWRRARAALGGRSFHAEHDEDRSAWR